MSGLHEPFRGTGILIRDRLPLLRTFLLAMTLLGCAWGLAARVFGAPNEALLTVLVVGVGVIPPVFGQLGMTLGGAVSDGRLRSRSRELLELPLGRLALPTAGAVVALLGLGISALTLLVSATVGGFSDDVASLFAEAREPAVLGIAAIAAAAHCAIQVGARSPQLSLWLVLAALLAVIGGLLWSGWGEADLLVFTRLATWGVVAGFLTLPFLIGAMGPHKDEVALLGLSTATRARAWVVCGWLVLFATLTVGVGVLWLAVSALSVLGARRVAAKAPPIRGWSAFGATHALLTLCLLPAAVHGLAVEVGHATRPLHPNWNQAEVSPDGRWVALPLEREGTQLTQVAILDARGEQPTRIVNTRMGRVAGWSSDSQLLAIHDFACGRVRVGVTESVELFLVPTGDSMNDLFLRWVGNRVSTLIVDTQGEVVERLSMRFVGPGWSAPEELVSLDTETGALALPSGELAPLNSSAVGFAGYTPAGTPMLHLRTTGNEPLVTTHRGQLAIARFAAWRDGAWAEDRAAARVEIDLPPAGVPGEPAPPRQGKAFGPQGSFDLGELNWAWTNSTGDTALVLDGETLSQVRADGRTVLGEDYAQAKDSPVHLKARSSGSCHLLGRADGRLLWVGPELELTPLPDLPDGDVLWLGPDALLVLAEGELRRVSWSGELLSTAAVGD